MPSPNQKHYDIRREDEHPNKTKLKRELRAIALKRLEDGARTVREQEKQAKEKAKKRKKSNRENFKKEV